MEPFLFGRSERRLFGIYHPPAAPSAPAPAVVLCCPMGQEYMRSHRAFFQLAQRLSGSGFPTLRFDYYGCGDSQGEDHLGRPREWVEDIATAIDEVRETSGAERVCLLGLRLGASLAVLAAAGRSDVERLLLWDPVRDGRRYLEEVVGRHRKRLQTSYAVAGAGTGASRVEPGEVLGFPLTPAMIADLEGLDLLAVDRRPAEHVLLIESSETGDAALLEHLRRLGAAPEQRRVPAAPIWLQSPDGFSAGLVPSHVLKAAVDWMAEAGR